VFRFAQAAYHSAHDLWRSFDEVPVVRVNGRGAHSDENLIIGRGRFFDLLDLEIGQAVLAINDGLHRITWRGSSFPIAIIGRSPVSDKDKNKSENQEDQNDAEQPFK